MALHKGWDRVLTTKEGAVKTTGFSTQLTKGQLGIFDMSQENQTKDGHPVVTDFAAQPADRKFEIKLGIHDNGLGRSQTNKSMSSFPFTIGNVKSLRVSLPDEGSVDEWLIGFDGTEGTELTFNAGETTELSINLEGEPMGLLGYVKAEALFKMQFFAPNAPEDVDDKAIVEEAVESFKKEELLGQYPITELIDITAEDTGGKMAIRIKGKKTELAAAEEALRYEIPFINSSLRISVAGGYLRGVNESNAQYAAGIFSVKNISRAAEKANLGGDLMDFEHRGRIYFTGENQHHDNYFARSIYGRESNLEELTGYVVYALEVERTKFSGGFNGRQSENITYHITAPVGSQAAVETLLNSLATAAGVETVTTVEAGE